MKIIKGVSPWNNKKTFLLVDKNKKVILANDNIEMLEEAKKIINKTKN